MSKSVDQSQALREAVAAGERFLREYTNQDRSNTCWSLFQALLERTRLDPCLKAGKPEECKYTYTELSEDLAYRTGNKAVFDASRLRKEYKNLSERLGELNISLANAAHKEGVTHLPGIVKEGTKGGRGKQSWLYITPVVIPANSVSNSQLDLAETSKRGADIHYWIEATPTLPFWARWMDMIDIGKHRWPWLLFTSIPMLTSVLLGIQVLLVQFGQYWAISQSVTQTLLIILVVYLLLFGWSIALLNNNITLLPDWMLPLRLHSAVVQYELKKPGANGRRIKDIKVLVYTAKCPVCEHRVELAAKSWNPFNGKIIGRCDQNPLEHRFSFDFTTLSGVRLECSKSMAG